jgi:AraC-like DNA-binding protein
MFVHSFRIIKQLDYLRSLGIDLKELYQKTGINPEHLKDPEKQFPLDTLIAVLDYALDKTGDPFYGLKMGQEPHIAGTIGMLCASCRNLKEAYMEGCRYFRIQGDFATIQFLEDDQHPGIRYSVAKSWLIRSPETARQEVEAMFSFLVTILRINSNHTLLPFRIKLSSANQTDPEGEYLRAFGIEPVFDQDENEILFWNKDLLIPMKAFNPETYELLRSHIEVQLKKYSGESSVSERVRSILLSSLRYSFPDINAVAAKLNMSPRTLQRQLSNEKTSFKYLLQDTRINLAKHLLKQKGFTISEISYMLGYSDLGNFSRSFKKYTGISPQTYRREIKV